MEVCDPGIPVGLLRPTFRMMQVLELYTVEFASERAIELLQMRQAGLEIEWQALVERHRYLLVRYDATSMLLNYYVFGLIHLEINLFYFS